MMKIAEYVKTMTAPRNFNSLGEAQAFLDKIYAIEEANPVYYSCKLVRHRPQLQH